MDKMIALGAKGTQKEFDAIVDYLAKTYPGEEVPKIKVNEARAIELESGLSLPRSQAAAIVQYRTKNGDFKSIEDLKKVPGVDVAKIEAQERPPGVLKGADMHSSRISAGVVLLFVSACANAQQAPPAAGAGRGGRGFGFTQPEPIDFADTTGWTSMFDGVSLKGWDGNMDLWHVENGTITVESTCEKPTGTVYLIWQGGQPADFELKAELRGEGAGVNSGIQYRSFIQPPGAAALGRVAPGQFAGRGGRGPTGPCPSGQPRGTPNPAAEAKWNLGGPQSDFDGTNRYSGQYYEGGTTRGIVAWRGPGGAGGRGQEAASAGHARRQGRTRRLRQDQRLEPATHHRARQRDDSHHQRARDVGLHR